MPSPDTFTTSERNETREHPVSNAFDFPTRPVSLHLQWQVHNPPMLVINQTVPDWRWFKGIVLNAFRDRGWELARCRQRRSWNRCIEACLGSHDGLLWYGGGGSVTRFPVLYSNASNVTRTHTHPCIHRPMCASLLQDNITLLGRWFYPKQLRKVFELYIFIKMLFHRSRVLHCKRNDLSMALYKRV